MRDREFDEIGAKLSAETGLPYRTVGVGEYVSGIFRQRVTLSSGRFAMIGDGRACSSFPWRPALVQQLGRQLGGAIGATGT